jgi:hypothetical protein
MEPTDIFANLQEGFDGQQVLAEFLPSAIQAAGVTIVNKNKYDISYQIQYDCIGTVSQGRLGINGAYAFKKIYVTHPKSFVLRQRVLVVCLGQEA